MIHLPDRLQGALVVLVGLPILLLGAASAGAPSAIAAPQDDGWHLIGHWRTYANADDVRAIADDADSIWVATSGGGVARWSTDGTWRRQYLAPQNGLPCNDVRDVLEWGGRWWFATCDGLAVYDESRDRMEFVPAELPSRSATAMAVDAANRLWVGTEQWWDQAAAVEGKDDPGGWVGGGVAYTADGATWHVLGADGGLPSANVRDIAIWQGAVWVATEPYWHWRPPSADPNENEDGRWEAHGGGVARRDGQAWRAYDSYNTSELSDNARCLAATDDTLWIGTGGRGLVAHSNGIWRSLQDCGDALRCIQDNFVTALAVGQDGAVWVGTSRFNGRGTGVNVLDDRGTPTDADDDAWHVLRAADGMPAERVHAILPVDDATVWFGVSHLDPEGRLQGRGLVHLQSDRRTMRAFSSASAAGGAVGGNDITALARHPVTGELWVGTGRSGVSVFTDSDGWRTYTRASTGGGLASDSISDIVIEPAGVVWIATRETEFDSNLGEWTDGGLSRHEDGRWTVVSGTASGLPSDHLSALALDGRGKLWVGTGATDRGPKEHAYRGWGLAKIDTRTLAWERTFTFPTLTSNNITDLAVQGNTLWVATSYFLYVDSRPGGAQISTGGGLSVHNLDTGEWHKLTVDQGLTPALRGRDAGRKLLDVRTVLADREGGVWVGGLAYPDSTFSPDDVPDGVIDVIGTDRVTSHRFPGAGAVLALAADRYGFIWAATERDGVHVRAEDQWISRGQARGGLPANDLTALSFDGGQVWLGTGTHGLVRLVDAANTGTIDPIGPPSATAEAPEATPEPPVIIHRLDNQIFLPRVKRSVFSRFVVIPATGVLPTEFGMRRNSTHQHD